MIYPIGGFSWMGNPNPTTTSTSTIAGWTRLWVPLLAIGKLAIREASNIFARRKSTRIMLLPAKLQEAWHGHTMFFYVKNGHAYLGFRDHDPEWLYIYILYIYILYIYIYIVTDSIKYPLISNGLKPASKKQLYSDYSDLLMNQPLHIFLKWFETTWNYQSLFCRRQHRPPKLKLPRLHQGAGWSYGYAYWVLFGARGSINGYKWMVQSWKSLVYNGRSYDKMDDLGGYPGWGNFQAFPMKKKKPLGAREIASRTSGTSAGSRWCLGLGALADDYC